MAPALLGIGNRLAQDDGVGPWVAQRMSTLGWDVYQAGATPENIVGKLAQSAPDMLVVVDAAELGLPPGSFRRLSWDATPCMLSSTHGLPLTFLLSLIRERVSELVMIGVQPQSIEPGEGLTARVSTAADELVELLSRGAINRIPLHRPNPPVDTDANRGEDSTYQGP